MSKRDRAIKKSYRVEAEKIRKETDAFIKEFKLEKRKKGNRCQNHVKYVDKH